MSSKINIDTHALTQKAPPSKVPESTPWPLFHKDKQAALDERRRWQETFETEFKVAKIRRKHQS